jgi:ubiquinone/menaquinone biosynthesis C-methylase UbiE
MANSSQDIWAQWLLHRRHGNDPQRVQAMLDNLYPVRDKVLNHANLGEGETLLDVGCGDGLIAFSALQQVPTCRVIFSDISQDLLDHARAMAQETNVFSRCEFVLAPAESLFPIQDASVDAVTTRSVLIYISEKQKAFNEFFRVLKPKGRLSIFEPINRFGWSDLSGWPEPPELFWGYDVTPVVAIANKVKEAYLRRQPPESDSMLNFDERDLLSIAENAGFVDIHLELQVHVRHRSPSTDSQEDGNWESFFRTTGNPRMPTLEEAIDQSLTPEEADKFISYLRPLVEARARKGTARSAVVYLWATKA